MKFSAVVILNTAGEVEHDENGVIVQAEVVRVIPLVTLIARPGAPALSQEESMLLTRIVAKQSMGECNQRYEVEGVELEGVGPAVVGDKN